MTVHRQRLKTFQAAYPSGGKDAVLSSPLSSGQLLVQSIAGYNNASSANNIGLGVRFASQAWKLWALGASNTDKTATVQAGSAVSIFDTTNAHGFFVQCKSQFDFLYLNVSQASTGSPVYTYEYWNGAAWATLNKITSQAYGSTGAFYLVFGAPLDWAQGNGSVLTDLASGAGYCLRIKASTAPSQAVQANAMSLMKFKAYRGQVAANQQLQVDSATSPFLLEAGEAVGAYFSVLDNSNLVNVAYQQLG